MRSFKEYLAEAKEHVGTYGFTSVHRQGADTIITHNGNMGNSIKEVEKGADEILGKGKFKLAKKHAHKESGSPDYAYSLHVKTKHLK